jgi:FKBP-type peptidyl-prolyl cis-trans isomerase FkpA
MIRRLIILISFCAVMLSCKKSPDLTGCPYTESTLVVPASEMTSLQAWVAANRPTAILHPGGFYYEINVAGTGTVAPTVCTNVTVKYAGYLTSGLKFTSVTEETVASSFTMGALILGWQRGLPLIKAGGSINLYVPPSLGYGANANGPIPANSILLFTVQLISVP